MNITITITSPDEAKHAIEVLQAYIVFASNQMRRPASGSIAELGLTVFTENVLKGEGIYRIEDLITWRSYDLLKIPRLGRSCLKDIEHNLRLRGLALSEDMTLATNKVTPPELRP